MSTATVTPVFFSKCISKEEFAKVMRKFLHATIILNFEISENNYQNELKNGYYWLTEFCEELDPQLKNPKS